MHICTVCFRTVQEHDQDCDCAEYHFPPCCCIGCDCRSYEMIHPLAAAQHGVQPTAYDAEIDAATDEIIRRGEDELQRRGG